MEGLCVASSTLFSGIIFFCSEQYYQCMNSPHLHLKITMAFVILLLYLYALLKEPDFLFKKKEVRGNFPPVAPYKYPSPFKT